MELQTFLTIKHSDTNVFKLLKTLFCKKHIMTSGGSSTMEPEIIEAHLLSVVQSINADKGKDLLVSLIEETDDIEEFIAESCEWNAPDDEFIASFIHGGDGQNIIEAMVYFLGNLCSGIDVNASLSGDGFAIIYTWENNKVEQEYIDQEEEDWDEEWEDEDDDD